MAEYRQVKQLSATDAAWLAGILDGEGTVTLTREKSWKPFRTPAISIASTTPELLEAVLEITGVGFISRKRATKAKHTASFHWKVHSGTQVLDILRQVIPFLRERNKLTRARLLVEQYQLLTHRAGKYTPEQARARLEFEERVLSYVSRAG